MQLNIMFCDYFPPVVDGSPVVGDNNPLFNVCKVLEVIGGAWVNSGDRGFVSLTVDRDVTSRLWVVVDDEVTSGVFEQVTVGDDVVSGGCVVPTVTAGDDITVWMCPFVGVIPGASFKRKMTLI